MDLRAKITDVLSVHEYAGKPGGPDCGGICDCPDLCACGAEVRSWRQHMADAVMGVVEAERADQVTIPKERLASLEKSETELLAHSVPPWRR